MNTEKKIGLFFGSFNPIHIGHLIIANFFVEHTDIDEVWFVVSPHNPLKNKAGLLDERHRFYMVQLAVEDHPKLKSSNIEFHLPQPSFTIHTLAVLTDKHPDYQFVLLMGKDNLCSLPKWKNYQTILENYQIYVYQRPEEAESSLEQHPSVKVFNAPLMHLSSSYIRNEIGLGHHVEYFLHPKVYHYIDEMNFYK